jgi:hypothetical protein
LNTQFPFHDAQELPLRGSKFDRHNDRIAQLPYAKSTWYSDRLMVKCPEVFGVFRLVRKGFPLNIRRAALDFEDPLAGRSAHQPEFCPVLSGSTPPSEEPRSKAIGVLTKTHIFALTDDFGAEYTRSV